MPNTLLEQININIPRFLTQKRSLKVLTAALLVFGIFFVLIFKQLGLIPAINSPSWLDYRAYTFILVFSGWVAIALSRQLMQWRSRRSPLSAVDCLIWLGIELVIIVAVVTVLAVFLNSYTLKAIPALVGRVVFSTFAILSIPYIITALIFMLNEKRHEVLQLTHQLSKADQSEAEPVGDSAIQFFDKGGKLSFATKRENLLYIEAADNYTIVHYVSSEKEDTFILHNSLKKLEEDYSSQGLVRCHRSYLVNASNIKYIRKENGGLVIEMAFCDKVIPVSKTYAESLVSQFTR